MKLLNKINRVLVSAIVLASIINPVMAEGQKSLASTLEVFAFPQKGQDSSQQSQDEAECYNWAVSNSGSDPFNLQKQKVANAEQAEIDKARAAQTGQGAGAGGAVRGAVVGAVIGEIVDDDSSKGAAVGATLGLVKNRRKARRAKKQATAQAEQNAQSAASATEGQILNFKKAFSVCLEAKSYLVKY